MSDGGVMTVKKIANRTGMTADAVRYYTRIGLLHPVRDPENDYRLFASGDIHRLLFIKRAKLIGFKLTEVAEIFADVEKGISPCPRVRSILQQHINQNRQHLDELNALQSRMEHAVRQWQHMDDGIPGEDSICYLIESFTEEGA